LSGQSNLDFSVSRIDGILSARPFKPAPAVLVRHTVPHAVRSLHRANRRARAILRDYPQREGRTRGTVRAPVLRTTQVDPDSGSARLETIPRRSAATTGQTEVDGIDTTMPLRTTP
jgi:hypothetical protein